MSNYITPSYGVNLRILCRIIFKFCHSISSIFPRKCCRKFNAIVCIAKCSISRDCSTCIIRSRILKVGCLSCIYLRRCCSSKLRYLLCTCYINSSLCCIASACSKKCYKSNFNTSCLKCCCSRKRNCNIINTVYLKHIIINYRTINSETCKSTCSNYTYSFSRFHSSSILILNLYKKSCC